MIKKPRKTKKSITASIRPSAEEHLDLSALETWLWGAPNQIRFTYDAGGRTKQVTDWNGNYLFAYDQNNRVTQKTLPGGKAIKHTYDAANNETARMDFLGGAYSYTYDTLNRPVQVTDPMGGTTGITYDKTWHVLQYHHPNATSVIYNYDPTYDVLSVANQKDSGEIISQFAYQYDAVGNPVTLIDNIGKTTYGYDSIYQLTSVKYPDRPAQSYGYDPVGNRLSMTVAAQNTNYAYNPANMLTGAGTENFTYDGNGNMVQLANGGQATNYAYDTENHLVQINLPNNTQSLFEYDYTGMRISDTEPGPNGNPETKSFLWNENDVVNEDSPYSQKSFNVLNGINLSESIVGKSSPNPKNLYNHFDGLGSVADTTDSGGNVLDTYRYDVYGQTLSGGQGVENDLQFVGGLGVRDQAGDGLLYMRNRWYNPQLGVFLSKDPLRLGNIYQYAENNPIRMIDPLGLDQAGATAGQIRYWQAFYQAQKDVVFLVAEPFDPVVAADLAQQSYEMYAGIQQYNLNIGEPDLNITYDPEGAFIQQYFGGDAAKLLQAYQTGTDFLNLYNSSNPLDAASNAYSAGQDADAMWDTISDQDQGTNSGTANDVSIGPPNPQGFNEFDSTWNQNSINAGAGGSFCPSSGSTNTGDQDSSPSPLQPFYDWLNDPSFNNGVIKIGTPQNNPSDWDY